jgi:hypothetical protein
MRPGVEPVTPLYVTFPESAVLMPVFPIAPADV